MKNSLWLGGLVAVLMLLVTLAGGPQRVRADDPPRAAKADPPAFLFSVWFDDCSTVSDGDDWAVTLQVGWSCGSPGWVTPLVFDEDTASYKSPVDADGNTSVYIRSTGAGLKTFKYKVAKSSAWGQQIGSGALQVFCTVAFDPIGSWDYTGDQTYVYLAK